jgi:flagellin-like hook-associated protein FlgL
MQSNSGFDAAIVSLRGAFDYVSAQRVFYGNTLNQAQSQATYLNSAKLQLSQQENALVGADIEAAASRLVNAENATNATLAAVGRISQLSLFDYLK